jgi:hypothetical protein
VLTKIKNVMKRKIKIIKPTTNNAFAAFQFKMAGDYFELAAFEVF